MTEYSPFLAGALAWIHPAGAPATCPECGFTWAASPEEVLEVIAAAPAAYEALLDGRDGRVPAGDGGWCATGYVWHLVDLCRSWTERWVQVQDDPGSPLVGWDPDVLAAARGYNELPTVPALWALRTSVAAFVGACGQTPSTLTFDHGDWGMGTVADGIRWLGHELVHHQLDVATRAG